MSIDSTIKKARDTAIEAEHKHVYTFIRKRAKSLALFKDLVHKEIWEFCMATGTNLEDYQKQYIVTTDKLIDPDYLNKPIAIELDEKGILSMENARQFIVRKFQEGKKVVECRLCYGSGFVSGITGDTCQDGYPQELIRIPCWCRR